MLIYLVLYFFNLVLAIANIFLKNEKIKEINYYVSLISMSFFLCFNYTNGVDWIEYNLKYNSIQKLYSISKLMSYFEIYKKEKLFSSFMFLCSKFYLNWEWFSFICLTISLIIIYATIRRIIGLKYTLIIVLFFYSQILMVSFLEPLIRQIMVLAIFYYSIVFVKNKKKSLLLLLIGFFIHSSAIFLIPFLWIDKIKYIKQKYILYILFVILVGVNIKTILNVAFNIVPQLRYVIWKSYLENIYSRSMSIELKEFIKYFLKIGIVTYTLLNYNVQKRNRKIKMYYNLSWINLYLLIIQMFFHIVSRFIIYFELFYLFFLIKILERKKNNILSIVIFLYFLLLSLNPLFSKRNRYIPYTNYIEYIFNNKTVPEKIKIMQFRR